MIFICKLPDTTITNYNDKDIIAALNQRGVPWHYEKIRYKSGGEREEQTRVIVSATTKSHMAKIAPCHIGVCDEIRGWLSNNRLTSYLLTLTLMPMSEKDLKNHKLW